MLVTGGIAALIVATALVVLVSAGREAEFEPGTPEAALQAYLAAYESGDLDEAYGHLSSRIREDWSAAAYEDAVASYGPAGFEGPSRRILFDRSEVEGETARVHLTVEEFSGDGLSGDTWRSPRVVRMVRENGAWLVDERLIGLDPGPHTIP